ncbi:MAG TPA: anhydro-N-acetylmuramic acid kinase [Terriglobales bacterium]
MSGTSADGIDVGLVRIHGRPPALRFQLLHLYSADYPAALRKAVLAVMAAPNASVADLARLNTRLSMAYADAVNAACKEALIERADLIGCHGQTIYHQGFPSSYLGAKVATTWQLADGSRIAALTGSPVVSDFRQADMAAGGRGAPLVPFFDFLAYRNRRRQRVVLNIGGIANVSVIPANAKPDHVTAFDTGPGNMMMDAAMSFLSQGKRNYDAGGRMAAKGRVQEDLLLRLMRNKYFKLKPPKSAGREEFGVEFTERWMREHERYQPEDLVATLTAFTAESIAFSVDRFGPRLKKASAGDVIASGGGTRNATLMRMLSDKVERYGYKLTTTDALGLPSQAKEAVAFAVLAYQTWHKRPSNLPSATGASRPMILGKISYA